MDFGSVLYAAQKNERKKEPAPKLYSTKFAPPKKEVKKQKSLSAGIQKFLARKEEEEKKKLEEERRKKEELLALRSQDKKSHRRVQSMLKRTKSANKSVIEDAIDDVNTAVTAAGPVQCDEDDYGYVSQDAAALYNKLMEKYSKMPAEQPKFPEKRSTSSKDLLSTKDRVKAALLKEEEDKLLPHKRRRKDKDKENGTENFSDDEKEKDSRKHEDGREDKYHDGSDSKSSQREKEKPKKPRKPMPPPMDFHELLKIAEQKKNEPVVIQKEAPASKKRQEPERLMTKKEKEEYERERERRLRRERQMAELEKRKSMVGKEPSSTEKRTNQEPSNGELENSPAEKRLKKDSSVWSSPSNLSSDKNSNLARKKVMERDREILRAKNQSSAKKPSSNDNYKKPDEAKRSSNSTPSSSGSVRRELSFSKTDEKSSSLLKNALQRPTPNSDKSEKFKSLPAKSDRSRILPDKCSKLDSPSKDRYSKESSKDIKPRVFPPEDIKPRVFPPKDLKPRKSLPNDSRSRSFPSSQSKKRPLKPVKRRIESDSEYDSELDDFIDDDDYDDPNEVSNVISQIFGYDKNKYRYLDDEDDSAMESNFHQVEREEFHSTKIGIMEDLEDIRREKEHERRKKMMMKQRMQQAKSKKHR